MAAKSLWMPAEFHSTPPQLRAMNGHRLSNESCVLMMPVEISHKKKLFQQYKLAYVQYIDNPFAIHVHTPQWMIHYETDHPADTCSPKMNSQIIQCCRSQSLNQQPKTKSC